MTDRERLDRVFEWSLCDDERILAEQNYACCKTCGHHELTRELIEAAHEAREEANEAGHAYEPAWLGYCFWHMQDDDVAFDPFGNLWEPLHISVSDRRTAWTVVTALRHAEFEVEWNGDMDQRIKVNPTQEEYSYED